MSVCGAAFRLYAMVPLTLLLFSLSLSCMACGNDAGAGQRQATVTSTLEGHITLDTAVDSSANFSGFEVTVGENIDGNMDTLAFAVTDSDGQFAMRVQAPRPNIYSLVISREGSILLYDEIAIADGDSASFKLKFPFGNRPVMIRSKENAALLGFKNTMALHTGEINRMQREGVNDMAAYQNRINQTTEILWSLRESSPNTLAASLAAAQSILMLERANDSLLVARAMELEANNPDYGRIIGAARRATVRLKGLEAAPALVETMRDKISEPDILAAAQSELVLAYRDNDEINKALDAARELKMNFATDSAWIRWADRAIYDLETLMPGMEAPAFSLVDTEGKTVTLDAFSGQYLVIEFYAPGPEFEQQLTGRNAFYRADKDGASFEILSISLQPDELMNEAFFDGRDIPGRHVFLAEGPEAEIIKTYNVYLLPTRFVIGPDGKIIGKYVLENSGNAFQDALTLSLSASSTSTTN